LLGIFLELHDPHTFYVMPSPYANSTAFLPFIVAACYDSQPPADASTDPEPFFVVTRVARDFECPGLEPSVQPGSLIGNGIPTAMAVHQLALRENGANKYSSFVQAVDHLTIRPSGVKCCRLTRLP
jgi:hypothetical protein